MLPKLKTYSIDYEWIISNYLDPSLWKKKWNLLVYKEHVFTLELNYISCSNRSISFKIKHNEQEYEFQSVDYYLDNTTLTVLKKQINGAIWRLMCSYERNQICHMDGYRRISSLSCEEDERLRDIARNYLDEQGVSNEDIRDVYIDNYVSRNNRTNIMLSNFVDAHVYKVETEMLLTFASIIDDKERKQDILAHCYNPALIKQVEEQVEEFKKEFEDEDEYTYTMVEELEAI